MPELPEVERAAALLRSLAKDQPYVRRVETSEDTIVYTAGITHTEFEKTLTGRNITNVGRYGKVFYLELDGEGKHPVLHFGMTGMLQVKGDYAAHYRKKPKNATIDWPPRFMKFILHLSETPDSPTDEDKLVAFLDPRRLGRIRLCASPRTEPPISTLGFDPLLNMLPLSEFSTRTLARRCPIKALLLDQQFSAGVGNWVADEILYHARVHPEQRSDTLNQEALERLYHWIVEVPKVAVAAHADDTKFPEDWLFKHRWDKGKKPKDVARSDPLLLPSGKPATIKWITVGGRTSAYVVELQRLEHSETKITQDDKRVGEKRSNPARKALSSRKRRRSESHDEDSVDESDLTPLSEDEAVMVKPKSKKAPSIGRRKMRGSA